MYLLRCWRQSLGSPSACWMRMARVHCTRHVWVTGLRTWSSCYDGASILRPPRLIASRSTVLLVCQVSGELTTSCCCCCCCCFSGWQHFRGHWPSTAWPWKLWKPATMLSFVSVVSEFMSHLLYVMSLRKCMVIRAVPHWLETKLSEC